MKAVKATYENGRVTLSESPPATGPIEVLVVFPEQADDPWERILADRSPRPELSIGSGDFIEIFHRKFARRPARPTANSRLTRLTQDCIFIVWKHFPTRGRCGSLVITARLACCKETQSRGSGSEIIKISN